MELLVPVAALLFVGLWVLAIADRARSRHCPYCVMRVHRDAVRCPHCTSQLEPAPPTGVDADIAARREADQARAAGGPPPVPGRREAGRPLETVGMSP